MKKTLTVAVVVASLVPAAWAQYGQALQRAKETANQNNVRQGVPPPAAPQPTAPAPGTPPANGFTPAQSLAALQGDLTGFKTGAAVSDAQKQQFTINLAKAARGTKPSLATVKKFVDSLTTALGTGTLTAEHRARLAGNLDAVLNSRGLSATVFDKTIADTQAILEVGTVKRNTAISVAADLKAIGAEIRR